MEYGFQGKELNFEFIQEVDVKTGGYEAEYGRSTGGIINVITKSGGNDVHGDVFGYCDADSLQSDTETIDSSNGTWSASRARTGAPTSAATSCATSCGSSPPTTTSTTPPTTSCLRSPRVDVRRTASTTSARPS